MRLLAIDYDKLFSPAFDLILKLHFFGVITEK